ncbi:hypothetical protein BS47DRAFT_1360433 [Hydnum rufescens UP504]|uniref:Uncharacterized protein n=1 Tax=Hydnum rufescens UP504 TaxID=1448309 RepID=A0A9P6B2F3_9AGAM|nr:hypothetical protein BS47DRAFT_1360433 [Hydnum rufescens UP504]
MWPSCASCWPFHALCQTYVGREIPWCMSTGNGIKSLTITREDDPTSAPRKPAASSGVDDNDGMDIFGVIMGNLSTQNSMTLMTAIDEDDDYRERTIPLDPGQENARRPSYRLQKMGMISAWQKIELVLRGAHGKKRGKSHNGKPAQSDFKTALMRLWRSSTKEERQRRTMQGADYAEADRSRNELEAIEKLKAEELRQEAEAHVREVEQHEHEASQSRQSAPTVSSAPPPPPPPPPPMPAPSSPATSGSAQHAPTASTTGPASLPPRPLHLLLDFLIRCLVRLAVDLTATRPGQCPGIDTYETRNSTTSAHTCHTIIRINQFPGPRPVQVKSMGNPSLGFPLVSNVLVKKLLVPKYRF